MTSLIIGNRGFVGGNLSLHIRNARGAGRAEIASLAGNTFSDIYCAAPQAKKWWANQNPDLDRQEVVNLIAACRQIDCTGSFVLFSTIDIYDPPYGKTERDLPGSDTHPYGANRFFLEQCILEHYGAKAKVVRLPALVGNGLKKNIIYDLINDNNVEQINPNSSFQWFNLSCIGEILRIADQIPPGVINVVTEPIPTADLVRAWFAKDLNRLNWEAPSVGYDVQTIHGKSGSPYLYSKEEVLEIHLKSFIEAEMAKQ